MSRSYHLPAPDPRRRRDSIQDPPLRQESPAVRDPPVIRQQSPAVRQPVQQANHLARQPSPAVRQPNPVARQQSPGVQRQQNPPVQRQQSPVSERQPVARQQTPSIQVEYASPLIQYPSSGALNVVSEIDSPPSFCNIVRIRDVDEEGNSHTLSTADSPKNIPLRNQDQDSKNQNKDKGTKAHAAGACEKDQDDGQSDIGNGGRDSRGTSTGSKQADYWRMLHEEALTELQEERKAREIEKKTIKEKESVWTQEKNALLEYIEETRRGAKNKSDGEDEVTLRERIRALAQKLDLLEEEKSVAKDRQSQLQDHNKKLESANGLLQAKLHRYERDFDHQSKKFARERRAWHEAEKSKVNRLLEESENHKEAMVSAAEDRLEQQQHALEALQAKMHENEQKLQRQTGMLKAENEILHKEKEMLQQELNGETGSIHQQRCIMLEEQVAHLHSALASAKADTENLRAEYTRRHEESQTAILTMKQRLDDIRNPKMASYSGEQLLNELKTREDTLVGYLKDSNLWSNDADYSDPAVLVLSLIQQVKNGLENQSSPQNQNHAQNQYRNKQENRIADMVYVEGSDSLSELDPKIEAMIRQSMEEIRRDDPREMAPRESVDNHVILDCNGGNSASSSSNHGGNAGMHPNDEDPFVNNDPFASKDGSNRNLHRGFASNSDHGFPKNDRGGDSLTVSYSNTCSESCYVGGSSGSTIQINFPNTHRRIDSRDSSAPGGSAGGSVSDYDNRVFHDSERNFERTRHESSSSTNHNARQTLPPPLPPRSTSATRQQMDSQQEPRQHCGSQSSQQQYTRRTRHHGMTTPQHNASLASAGNFPMDGSGSLLSRERSHSCSSPVLSNPNPQAPLPRGGHDRHYMEPRERDMQRNTSPVRPQDGRFLDSDPFVQAANYRSHTASSRHKVLNSARNSDCGSHNNSQHFSNVSNSNNNSQQYYPNTRSGIPSQSPITPVDNFRFQNGYPVGNGNGHPPGTNSHNGSFVGGHTPRPTALPEFKVATNTSQTEMSRCHEDNYRNNSANSGRPQSYPDNSRYVDNSRRDGTPESRCPSLMGGGGRDADPPQNKHRQGDLSCKISLVRKQFASIRKTLDLQRR